MDEMKLSKNWEDFLATLNPDQREKFENRGEVKEVVLTRDFAPGSKRAGKKKRFKKYTHTQYNMKPEQVVFNKFRWICWHQRTKIQATLNKVLAEFVRNYEKEHGEVEPPPVDNGVMKVWV